MSGGDGRFNMLMGFLSIEVVALCAESGSCHFTSALLVLLRAAGIKGVIGSGAKAMTGPGYGGGGGRCWTDESSY